MSPSANRPLPLGLRPEREPSRGERLVAAFLKAAPPKAGVYPKAPKPFLEWLGHFEEHGLSNSAALLPSRKPEIAFRKRLRASGETFLCLRPPASQGRCWRCEGCWALMRQGIALRGTVEALDAEAVYFVTLTVPKGTSDALFWDHYQAFRLGMRETMRPAGATMGFVRTLERTKAGTLHAHLLVAFRGDYEPLWLYEHWPFLAHCELVSGRGVDLCGHIPKSQLWAWSREKRENAAPHLPWEVRKRSASGRSPAGAAFYVAKYIGKGLNAPDALGPSVRGFETSALFGSPYKVLRVLHAPRLSDCSALSDEHYREAHAIGMAASEVYADWFFTVRGYPVPKAPLLRAAQIRGGFLDPATPQEAVHTAAVVAFVQEILDKA